KRCRSWTANLFDPHIVSERLRDQNGSIGLLVGFHKRNVKPGEGGARAIQGMTKTILSISILKFKIHSACLIFFGIRATRDFQIPTLPGSPDFQIVSFRHTEPKIPGTKFDDSIVQAKHLQYSLGVRRQLLQFVIGSLRSCNLDQFDFIKLVNTNDATRVSTRRSSLAPKTRRVSHEIFRQLPVRQRLLAMQVCQRHLGSRNQKGLSFLQPVSVFLEFRQLSGTDHAFTPHKMRRADFDITMFYRMEGQEKLD